MKQILDFFLKIGEQDQFQLLVICAKFDSIYSEQNKSYQGLKSLTVNTFCDSTMILLVKRRSKVQTLNLNNLRKKRLWNPLCCSHQASAKSIKSKSLFHTPLGVFFVLLCLSLFFGFLIMCQNRHTYNPQQPMDGAADIYHNSTLKCYKHNSFYSS